MRGKICHSIAVAFSSAGEPVTMAEPFFGAHVRPGTEPQRDMQMPITLYSSGHGRIQQRRRASTDGLTRIMAYATHDRVIECDR